MQSALLSDKVVKEKHKKQRDTLDGAPLLEREDIYSESVKQTLSVVFDDNLLVHFSVDSTCDPFSLIQLLRPVATIPPASAT